MQQSQEEQCWYRRARQGAIDYYKVFGCWPEKIGFHKDQILHQDTLTFMEVPRRLPTLEDQTVEEALSTHLLHRISFDLIQGKEILREECYFPHPYHPTLVISAEALVSLVPDGSSNQGFRPSLLHGTTPREEGYARYYLQQHRRAVAAHKAEVDVCRECYERHFLLHQLNHIYPDVAPGWIRPQCDYCDHPAKFHIKRSDWRSSRTTEKEDAV